MHEPRAKRCATRPTLKFPSRTTRAYHLLQAYVPLVFITDIDRHHLYIEEFFFFFFDSPQTQASSSMIDVTGYCVLSKRDAYGFLWEEFQFFKFSSSEYLKIGFTILISSFLPLFYVFVKCETTTFKPRNILLLLLLISWLPKVCYIVEKGLWRPFKSLSIRPWLDLVILGSNVSSFVYVTKYNFFFLGGVF